MQKKDLERLLALRHEQDNRRLTPAEIVELSALIDIAAREIEAHERP
jgi:hypothetical protein